MIFTIDEVQYRINFSQLRETNYVRGLGDVDQRSTQVIIRTGERDTEAEEIVAEGKVTQFYKDQFCYETGRKEALKLALEGHSRDFRTAAWKAYHSRQGGILNKTVWYKLTGDSHVGLMSASS